MKGTTKNKNLFSHSFFFSCSGYCHDLFGAVVFVSSAEKVFVNGLVGLFSSCIWFHVASVMLTELFPKHVTFLSATGPNIIFDFNSLFVMTFPLCFKETAGRGNPYPVQFITYSPSFITLGLPYSKNRKRGHLKKNG